MATAFDYQQGYTEAIPRAGAQIRTEAKRKRAAVTGKAASACFSRGVELSTGLNGHACDMIEAHKWFNIATTYGHRDAARCRTEIASEMSVREVTEAQRRAREWLKQNTASS